MPLYDFICESCGVEEEVLRSFSEELPTICPNCGEEKPERFHQIYSGGEMGIVKGEPTTFGQQAEINAKRMGKEQMDRMAEEYATAHIKGRETMKLPAKAKRYREKYKAQKPWWRDSNKPLDVRKIRNPKKYIETGETI